MGGEGDRAHRSRPSNSVPLAHSCSIQQPARAGMSPGVRAQCLEDEGEVKGKGDVEKEDKKVKKVEEEGEGEVPGVTEEAFLQCIRRLK